MEEYNEINKPTMNQLADVRCFRILFGGPWYYTCKYVQQSKKTLTPRQLAITLSFLRKKQGKKCPFQFSVVVFVLEICALKVISGEA
jgi:hypothetical protein